MNQTDKEKMIKLYQLGVPKTKIAKELGCSPATITYNLKQINVSKPDPMIGRRFGKLIVLQRAEKNPNLASRCIRYQCQCDCGNIIEVNGNSLRSGHTQSCGCMRKENTPYNNLLNQRFGKLVVIELMQQSTLDRRKIWKCQCDCGNICYVSSHALLDGHTKSCGCLHSYAETQIANFLQEHNIIFQQEYIFQDLLGNSGFPLRFDFAIFDNNYNLICLLEYQGEQHYDLQNNWHTKQLEISDEKKKNYCMIHNIPFYELNKNSDLIIELERICKQWDLITMI